MDGAESIVAGLHQRRAPEERVPGCVGLLPAEGASGAHALVVVALWALATGFAPYPVQISSRTRPVPGAELVDVNRH